MLDKHHTSTPLSFFFSFETGLTVLPLPPGIVAMKVVDTG